MAWQKARLAFVPGVFPRLEAEILNISETIRLRRGGCSWREIGKKLGVGATTARRHFCGFATGPATTLGV